MLWRWPEQTWGAKIQRIPDYNYTMRIISWLQCPSHAMSARQFEASACSPYSGVALPTLPADLLKLKGLSRPYSCGRRQR